MTSSGLCSAPAADSLERGGNLDKVRWGVLGTADIASSLVIPAMQKAENSTPYAVAGRSQEKADRFRSEFGFERAYGALAGLLEDPEVDAVYVALPNEMHKEWCIRAAAAGKDILCEKPLAPSLADAEEMFAAAEKNGVKLVEGFAYLHSPYMDVLRREIQSGVLGELLFIESEFVTSDYNPGNIRMQRDRLGGAMLDLGCYVVSQILYLTGAEPGNVQACGELNEDGIDILVAGMMPLTGQLRALFTTGMVLATDKDRRIDRFEVHGSEGYVRSRTKFNEEGQVNYIVRTETEQKAVTVTAPNNYVLEIEHVGRYFLSGGEPPVPKALSLGVARVVGQVLSQIGY